MKKPPFTHPRGVIGSWVQIRQGRMGRRRSNVRRAPVSLHYATKTATKLSGKVRAGPAGRGPARGCRRAVHMPDETTARPPPGCWRRRGGRGRKDERQPTPAGTWSPQQSGGRVRQRPPCLRAAQAHTDSQCRLVLGAREGTETLYTRGSASTHCLRLHSTCSVSFWSPRLISHSASFKTPAPRITKLKLSRVPPPGVRVSS
jgi:hypothetical protein